MTAKEVLQQYAGAGKGVKIAARISAALFIVCVVIAIIIGGDAGGGLGVLSIFPGAVWLGFGLSGAVINSRFKKSIARLEQLGVLDAAAVELTAQDTYQHGKDSARLSNNFYYGKKSGIILRYDDILLAYKYTHRQNFVVVEESLMLGTKTMGIVKATSMGRDKYKVVESAMSVIAQHNPQMLVGYTHDNLRAYKQTVKNIKNGIES